MDVGVVVNEIVLLGRIPMYQELKVVLGQDGVGVGVLVVVGHGNIVGGMVGGNYMMVDGDMSNKINIDVGQEVGVIQVKVLDRIIEEDGMVINN